MPSTEDVEDAEAYFEHLRDRQADPPDGEALRSETRAWLRRADERVQGILRHQAFNELVDAVRSHARSAGTTGEPPPPPVERLSFHQLGDRLSVAADAPTDGAGSFIANLPAATGRFELALGESDGVDRNAFWQTGTPPSWTEDWGTDEYGAWATFAVEAEDGTRVTQRLRWIPPGQFTIGSPKDEPGRFNDEGPQQEVTIREGFWLFATPLTQALYEAVTGENPSRFEGPERPVENVSWNEAQAFLRQLNERVAGLNLALPSEAQWEYACRAGTTAAIYAGPIDILGENNAPILDEIAWYGGNSGGESQPVGSKRPNPWGLYDMLGNVWEWCADHWHDSYEGAPSDGSAWIDVATIGADTVIQGSTRIRRTDDERNSRVIRGGSWFVGARRCRAACRYRYPPVNRRDYLGFRPARGQGARSDGRGAVPVEAAWRGRSPASQPEPVAAQAVRVVPGAGAQTVALPRAGAFRVRSDHAELTFRRLTKPDWASGLGRDRFGLFAEITVEEVTQRLRWIPPGRFLMGSSEDEPGRFEWEESQHDVAIREGFWLFATPVTQALYEAVVGANPSRFESPDRPVEQVSWHDAQAFLARLDERLPGLDLMLPSEAQWEYACRAGTTTATFAGPIDILGKHNAPILDDIAWYGGNSGVDFDLEKGFDSSDWPEKQYEHGTAGTRRVATRKPNPWGLFDMLGNVLEWCADPWSTSYDGAPTDGNAWVDEHGNAWVDEHGKA